MIWKEKQNYNNNDDDNIIIPFTLTNHLGGDTDPKRSR